VWQVLREGRAFQELGAFKDDTGRKELTVYDISATPNPGWVEVRS
jgi:hypothetical protein